MRFFYKIRSLQGRLTVFLLLPVAMVLLLAGAAGFLRARAAILQEWQEAAALSLGRATHEVDMRLRGSTDWILAFQESFGEMGAPRIQSWILEQLKRQSWVKQVEWKRGEIPESKGVAPRLSMSHHHGHGGEKEPPSLPAYELRADPAQGVLEMGALLKGSEGEPLGRLLVTMDLQALLGEALKYGWRESEQACLVDEQGRFLAHAGTLITSRNRLGESKDPLELEILSEMAKRPSGTVWGPGMPPGLIAGFHRLEEVPWTMVLFARGADVLSPVLRFRDYYLAALALVVLVTLVLIRLVVGPRASLIQKLSSAAAQVARGEYGFMAPPRGDDEISRLVRSFNQMVEGLKEKDFVSNTFGRYIDPEIAREILSRPEASRLGGQKRAVAILIADLRGFTPLAESLTPEHTIQILNRYFGLLIQVIQRHRGIIVDFFGDSVLAFFDPLEGPLQEAVARALRCAFEMQDAMGPFNERNLKEGLPELQMGVGVHAGEVIVGNIGSESRAKYGIVGSAVNLTQRIQQLAGAGEVVVSEGVYVEAKDLISPMRTMEAQLKGVQEPMKMYVVRSGWAPGSDDKH